MKKRWRIGELVYFPDPVNPIDGEVVKGAISGLGQNVAYVNVSLPDGTFMRDLNIAYDKLSEAPKDAAKSHNIFKHWEGALRRLANGRDE